jgi:hypothetical protein
MCNSSWSDPASTASFIELITKAVVRVLAIMKLIRTGALGDARYSSVISFVLGLAVKRNVLKRAGDGSVGGYSVRRLDCQRRGRPDGDYT